MLRSRESKFGSRGLRCAYADTEARSVGKSRSFVAGADGSWWSKEVSRFELWIVTGISTRISCGLKPDFWRLSRY